MTQQITKPQLGRLQTLYGQLAAHDLGVSTSREGRLRWATERLRKPVSSFSNLSAEDAGFLINSLQDYLGVKAPLKKRLNRDQARRAGLDGRKDGSEYRDAPAMVTANELRILQSILGQLGWDDARFRGFLDSSRSPLQRADKTIRTVNDANKVIWALKRIARQQFNAMSKGAA